MPELTIGLFALAFSTIFAADIARAVAGLWADLRRLFR
jgi:hypothetical protein